MRTKIKRPHTRVTEKKTFLLFSHFFILMGLLLSTNTFAQIILPPANISCSSKDLEITRAILPAPANDPCNCSGSRILQLGIANKTGSNRTSFAMWGKLIRKDASGNPIGNPETIFACASGIDKNSTKFYLTTTSIEVHCNESLDIIDLILAWTSASPGETCDVLRNNPSTINPKCGRVDAIRVETGVDASFTTINATCTAGGSIQVSPFGGLAPYKVKIGTDERTGIAAGGSVTFSNLSANSHSILITDSRPCSTTKNRSVGAADAVTANAGPDFTKTCISNASGQQIGEASQTGFTYSWSPAAGLNDANVSNPTANPTITTTYTVRKTYTATGCYDDDDVTVTVNNTIVTANAGDDFSKTCVNNINGAQIGEASVTGFTYSWLPVAGLSAADVSNPTANPSSTTVYTVTKTFTSSGCTNTDEITVTVNNTTVSAQAGTDFTKTCTLNTSGQQIGEASVTGFTYSWLPVAGLSAANVSNPTANPSSTTVYTLTKTFTSSGCTNTDEITVTVNNTATTFTVCLVQPDLCNQYGSVAFSTAGTSDLNYSIDNGTAFTNTSGIFNNLISGSVTGFKLRNAAGCVATLACNAASTCTTNNLRLRTEVNQPTTQQIIVEEPTKVTAYPNPFSNKVKFVVTSAISGKGSLEVYNMLGQKIKSVYQGQIIAGNQIFELSLPSAQRSNLIYVLRVGDKRVTGKLLHLNR
jgi:hypothetical protein